MKWFNFYGLIFLAIIMIPNIIFAATHKEVFSNAYSNKVVEIFEQIGRIGCFVFMFINIPPLVFGFSFNGAFTAYLICGGLLTLLYVIGWIIFRKHSSVAKSLYLSIVPSALFICCGVFALNIPLIAAGVIFAPCHIFISYKNAKATA